MYSLGLHKKQLQPCTRLKKITFLITQWVYKAILCTQGAGSVALWFFQFPANSGVFYRPEASDEVDRVVSCCAEFRRHLEHLNDQRASEIQAHLIKAVKCCLGTIRWVLAQGCWHGWPQLRLGILVVCVQSCVWEWVWMSYWARQSTFSLIWMLTWEGNQVKGTMWESDRATSNLLCVCIICILDSIYDIYLLYTMNSFIMDEIFIYGIKFSVTSAFSLMDQRLPKYQERIHWFLRKFQEVIQHI